MSAFKGFLVFCLFYLAPAWAHIDDYLTLEKEVAENILKKYPTLNYFSEISKALNEGLPIFNKLHLAILDSNLKEVEAVLGAGADIQTTIATADVSPAYLASLTGQVDLFGYLWKKQGCYIRRTIGVNNPLHLAAIGGHPEMVKALLKEQFTDRANGIPSPIPRQDLHKKNARGQTALHLAFLHNHEEVIDLLLGAGASWTVKDNADKSPLDLAVGVGNPKVIVKLLKNRLVPADQILVAAMYNKNFRLVHSLVRPGRAFFARYFDWALKEAIGASEDQLVRLLVQGFESPADFFKQKGHFFKDAPLPIRISFGFPAGCDETFKEPQFGFILKYVLNTDDFDTAPLERLIRESGDASAYLSEVMILAGRMGKFKFVETFLRGGVKPFRALAQLRILIENPVLPEEEKANCRLLQAMLLQYTNQFETETPLRLLPLEILQWVAAYSEGEPLDYLKARSKSLEPESVEDQNRNIRSPQKASSKRARKLNLDIEGS